MRHFLLLVLGGYLFLFISCKKYDPAPAAFFITNDQVSVHTTTAQGTNSHKITDLWLYVNGQFQGAYPLGSKMPIMTYGKNAKIDILSGIKNSGINEKSINWFIYDKISFDTLVESGKTISRPFVFKYNPAVKFLWQENFDNPNGFSLIKSPGIQGSDTTFKIASPANSFEGKSAEIGITEVNHFARLESSISYTLPPGNPNVYLEINYKATYDFEVGLTANSNAYKGALVVRSKDTWNKIYIQLSDPINTEPVSSTYKVYFLLHKPNAETDAHVWLDNIKLIYL
ncbi:MAG: hypothetical protein K0S32_4320 [Bacteroidetes bacterium]|jgi:hypothetical protein|nr:hypothetical protein [Bacteroidota bacterium]